MSGGGGGGNEKCGKILGGNPRNYRKGWREIKREGLKKEEKEEEGEIDGIQ